MPTADEYVARIKAFQKRDGLLAFIKTFENGDDQFWKMGKAFEYGLIRGFELENAEVRYPFHITGRPGGLDAKPGIIEQIDGVIYLGHIAAIIESKDYDKAIDIEPIAKLRFRLERRPAGTFGVIFSRKGITKTALYLLRNSHPKNILVWQELEIEVAFQRGYLAKGLVAKYQHAVEFGLPDYNILEEFEDDVTSNH